MTLKPLSSSFFYATLFAVATVTVTHSLVGWLVQPVLETPNAHDLLARFAMVVFAAG